MEQAEIQPDFNNAAEGLRIAAPELSNYVHLLAVREGASVLDAIR
jgi:hypothetical protein